MYEGNLYLPIGITVGPKGVPPSQISRYFTIKAFVEEIGFKIDSDSKGGGFFLKPFRSFDYKPCSQIDDQHIQEHIKSFVAVPGFGDLITCPDFKEQEKDFVASSDYLTMAGNWVSIKIYPCSLPDPSQCATPEEVANLKIEYTYPSKLLKLDDFQNPVESLPVRLMLNVDPRSVKVSQQMIRLNKVYDDTMSLIPLKLKAEYTTLVQRAFDFKIRDPTQLHCSRQVVEMGGLGNCREYLAFEFFPDTEIAVTTRSYKSLRAMLGEFGGILKIITTSAFFVYGVYSLRKVKSLLGGIILTSGASQGSQNKLKELLFERKRDLNAFKKGG